MKTLTVWQCDAEGYLVGRTIADESPLEPGTFLIPAGAIATKPPYPTPEPSEWRWSGCAWELVAARPPMRLPTPEERLAAFLKANPDVSALLDR
ncbi:TPA: hypothetical protein ACKP8A_000714 [Stenotrophomonas maltophilia]